MITVTGTNNKRVKDPVFLSARKFMEDRIARLEAAGPGSAHELALAKKRYEGLTAKDVIIEPPVSFNSGVVRCCFVSRKTGFLRADIEVEIVDIALIFAEFALVPTEYIDTDTFVAAVKDGTQGRGFIYLHDTERYGVVLEAGKANPDEVMDIMEDIYWDKIKTDSFPQMDAVSKASGAFTVEAINIQPHQGDMFFIEDIRAIV